MFLAAHLMYNKHPKSNILPSPHNFQKVLFDCDLPLF